MRVIILLETTYYHSIIKNTMHISVLSHTLDWEFSAHLTLALFHHGLTAQVVSIDNHELWLNELSNNVEGLVVILRPEFIDAGYLMNMLKLADECNIHILPVVRAPIDISMWPSNIALANTIDFTDHDERYFEAKLADVANVLKLINPSLKVVLPSQLEVHISKLLLNTSRFNILEQLSYISKSSQSLSHQFIENMRFETRSNILPIEAKNETLKSIANYYPRVILESANIHCRTLVKHLVHHTINRYSSDPINSPIPVVLDIGNGNIDENWFKQSIPFSKSVFRDVNKGKILLIVHGFENSEDRISSFFEFLDRKIDIGNSFLRIFIVAREIKHVIPFSAVNIRATELTMSDIKEFTDQYNYLPAIRFLTSIEKFKLFQLFRYFTFTPLFLTQLMLLPFDIPETLEEFDTRNCYSNFIQYSWQIGCRVNNDHESKLGIAISGLVKLSALLTNQGRTEFNFDEASKLLGGKFTLQTCIDGGLLRQIGNAIYFSELFLQDYFAALALQEFGLPSKLPSMGINVANDRVNNVWDRSLILLTHLNTKNEKLLVTLMRLDPLLALDAVKSGCPITPTIYTQIIEKNLSLLRHLGDFRVAFAKRLQAIDEKTAKAVLLETMREGGWDLRIASLQVLNEFETPSLMGIISILTDTFDDHDPSITYALRRIGSDSTITLLKLMRHDDPMIRKRSIRLIGKLNDKVASPALIEKLKDTSQEVVLEALSSIAILSDLQTLSPLAQASKNASRKVAKAIQVTLAKILLANPKEFTKTTQNLDVRSRYIVVLLMCNSIEQSILDFALTFSYDSNPDVRIAALQSFLYSEDVKVINRLKECLNDTEQSSVRKYTVREIAAKILAASRFIGSPQKTIDAKTTTIANNKRKSSEIVKARLINAKTTSKDVAPDLDERQEYSQPVLVESHLGQLTDDDLRIANILKQMREQGWDTSNDAAKQLRDYAKQLRGKVSTRIMNQIIETLNDEDWVIRWAGVETLGWIGNVNVVPHLIQRLADTNWKIRVAAIRSLAEIKDETAIGSISEIMTDEHSVVREAAAEALGHLGSEKSVSPLEKASSDPEEFVRLAAVESLGRIKHNLAVDSLLSSLKDNSDHVRWAAANALVGIATPQISSILAKSLNDTGGPYWEQKRICDVIADILEQINTDEAKSALALWRKNQAQSSN